ncbi:MAG: hypothetical protein AVO35_12925 [Candidatus Aegiribacteria sp. MLS_C]|nr:MAG: hypothetical protein AVO35_12925 [Candidatus Aegiribacteria sp. MLS_C]
MLTTLIVLMMTVNGSEITEPVYSLDFPGVGFEFMPEVMSPPVEGTIEEDAGVLTGAPNQHGVDFRLYYWREDLEENTRKDQWLSEKFRDIIPPELLQTLVIGQAEWIEGSTGSSRWETSSIGLVPFLNFNSIDGEGNVLAVGRACAFFTEGYSMLFYGIGPRNGDMDVEEEFMNTVAGIFLL